MKFLPSVPAYLMAFLFVFSVVNFFHPLAPMPAMTGDQATFFTLFMSTGYMKVVKIIELIGAILLVLPSKRALGILILTPISVNILLFEVLVAHAPGIGIALVLVSLFIVYQERAKINVF